MMVKNEYFNKDGCYGSQYSSIIICNHRQSLRCNTRLWRERLESFKNVCFCYFWQILKFLNFLKILFGIKCVKYYLGTVSSKRCTLSMIRNNKNRNIEQYRKK
jgi:hypothetical protein